MSCGLKRIIGCVKPHYRLNANSSLLWRFNSSSKCISFAWFQPLSCSSLHIYIFFLFFPSEAWVGTPGVQPMECNKLAPPHCVWHTNPEAKHPADIMSFNLSVFYKHCKYLQPFNELTRSHRCDTVWGHRDLPGLQPGGSFVFSQFLKFSGIDRGHTKTAPATRTMKIYIWKWEN